MKPMKDLELRYLTDSPFQHATAYLEKILRETNLSPADISDALSVACERFSRMRPKEYLEKLNKSLLKHDPPLDQNDVKSNVGKNDPEADHEIVRKLSEVPTIAIQSEAINQANLFNIEYKGKSLWDISVFAFRKGGHWAWVKNDMENLSLKNTMEQFKYERDRVNDELSALKNDLQKKQIEKQNAEDQSEVFFERTSRIVAEGALIKICSRNREIEGDCLRFRATLEHLGRELNNGQVLEPNGPNHNLIVKALNGKTILR